MLPGSLSRRNVRERLIAARLLAAHALVSEGRSVGGGAFAAGLLGNRTRLTAGRVRRAGFAASLSGVGMVRPRQFLQQFANPALGAEPDIRGLSPRPPPVR